MDRDVSWSTTFISLWSNGTPSLNSTTEFIDVSQVELWIKKRTISVLLSAVILHTVANSDLMVSFHMWIYLTAIDADPCSSEVSSLIGWRFIVTKTYTSGLCHLSFLLLDLRKQLYHYYFTCWRRKYWYFIFSSKSADTVLISAPSSPFQLWGTCNFTARCRKKQMARKSGKKPPKLWLPIL